MRRSSLTLVVAAATAAALSACSGAGTDAPSSRASAPSSAATPTSGTAAGGSSSAGTSTKAPDPTASASAGAAAIAGIPAAAKAHTPAGAEAFTRHFFEVVNKAWTTPTVGAIASLSEPTCKSCASLESSAKYLADKGHRAQNPPLRITSVDAASKDGEGRQTVILVGQQVPNVQVDGSGKPVGSPTTADRLKREVTLTESTATGGWRVVYIRVIP